MANLSRNWKWHAKYKVIIRCPQCNARHYPTRLDWKHLSEDGFYAVRCGCGYEYRIKEGKEALVISGGRYQNGK